MFTEAQKLRALYVLSDGDAETAINWLDDFGSVELHESVFGVGWSGSRGERMAKLKVFLAAQEDA